MNLKVKLMPGHHQDAEYSPNRVYMYIYIRNRTVRTPPHINVVFDGFYLQYINVKETTYIYISTYWKNNIFIYINIYIYHLHLYVKSYTILYLVGVLSVLLKKKVLSVLLFKRVLSDGSRNPTCLFTFSKGGSKCLSVAIVKNHHLVMIRPTHKAVFCSNLLRSKSRGERLWQLKSDLRDEFSILNHKNTLHHISHPTVDGSEKKILHHLGCIKAYE